LALTLSTAIDNAKVNTLAEVSTKIKNGQNVVIDKINTALPTANIQHVQ